MTARVYFVFEDGHVEERDASDPAELPKGVVDWWIFVPKEEASDLREE